MTTLERLLKYTTFHNEKSKQQAIKECMEEGCN